MIGLLGVLLFFGWLSDSLHVSLARALEPFLHHPLLEKAAWGLSVQDALTGEVYLAYHADVPLIPASNLKLLTTAAALDRLGPDYRYQTTLYFRGRREGDRLTGDFILKGSGDPSLGSASFDTDPFQVWADSLYRQGIRQMAGRLIGDDNIFPDDVLYPEGWDLKFLKSEAFAAPRGGLIYGDNRVQLWIDARHSPGHRPDLYSNPPRYLRIENRARIHRRRTWSFRLDRPLGSSHILVQGNIPYRYLGFRELPVHQPTRFALFSLIYRLSHRGIDTEHLAWYDIDDLPEPVGYAGSRPLFVHLSPPLRDLLVVVNKESQNLYAEQLFLTLGGGHPRVAVHEVHTFLRRMGLSTEGLVMEDGSGLSRRNLVPPRLLSELLVAMRRHPQYRVFYRSLPHGGEPNTTLEDRLEGVSVRAKTGSLARVRALSGYVRTRDGRELAFSLLVNNYTGRSRYVEQLMDRMVEALARVEFVHSSAVGVQPVRLP